MSAPLRRKRRSQASTIALRLPNRRIVVAIGIVLILAVVAFAGLRLYQFAKISSHSGIGDILGLAQNQDDTPGTLAYKIHHGERVNILMMGYGGAGHDGGYLADSIMVISVQGTDRVAMTSVPRDTYAKIKAFSNGGEYAGKINAAYEIPMSKGAFGPLKPDYSPDFNGGGKLASQVVGDYLGVHIDYWVGIDFTAFKKVVDAIGGVDINNPYVLDDDQYPLGETGGYTHVHFDAGQQHLNGDRALIYVRERHADSDFGRSKRQQQVVAAIKDKVLSANAIPQIPTLMDALQENVHTSLSPNDIRAFSGILNKINTSDTHHVSLDSSNWQYSTLDPSAGYILLARDKSMNSLRHYIANELPNPKVLGEKANVQIASTSGQASNGDSLAGIMTGSMAMLNFTMVSPATGSAAPATTEVHDYSGGKGTETAKWMAAYFGGIVTTESPGSKPSPVGGAVTTPGASPAPATSPDIVVVLGKDFSTNFDQAERPVYTPPKNYVPPRQYPTPAPVPTTAPTSQPTREPTAPPTHAPPTVPPCKPLCSSPNPGGGGGGVAG
jgi:LCP family protein required for cell wall assembly